MSENFNQHGKPDTKAVDHTVADVLGQFAWLMSQSPTHKHMFIADLEWSVMTPILLKQFKILTKEGRPVAGATWATVSDEVAARSKNSNTKLQLQDWRSGPNVVVVDVLAPLGGGGGRRISCQTARRNRSGC